MPSGDIEVAEADGDDAIEVCEAITLSLGTLANDADSIVLAD